MKRFTVLAAVVALLTTLLILPTMASAFQITGGGGTQTQSPYGLWYAGKEACAQEGCHRSIAQKPSPHSNMVTDLKAYPEKLMPAATSALWPLTSPLGGITLQPRDMYLQLGDHEGFLEYTGTNANPLAKLKPSDDLPVWSPMLYLIDENIWEEPTAKMGNSVYGQSCADCHNVGLTRPSNAEYTLPNGAVQTTNTPTTVSELGIQCEACHASGKNPGAHKGVVPEVVGGYQILKSQTCGQCHVTGTTPQKNVNGSAFGNPNGFTTDTTLSAYLTPASVVETEGQLMAYLDGKGPKPKFLPNGADYSMRHTYYNEWLVNKVPSEHGGNYGHADPVNGTVQTFAGAGETKCLRCHSGLGFLNRIDAKSPSGTRIVPTFPTLSTVTKDDPGISCMVCHTGHVQYAEGGGYDSMRRWGNGRSVQCTDCHNWQFEQLEQAVQYEIIDGVSYSRPAAGAKSRHAQREMVSGGKGGDDGLGGLWGVAPMEETMPGAECKDCHMPRTHKEGMPANDTGSKTGTRMSHRFHVVLPGDAERWKLRPNGDSCAASCHNEDAASYTRADFQSWIEQKREAVASASSEATTVLDDVAAGLGLTDWNSFIAAQPVGGPASGLNAATWAMLQHAAQNVDMVAGDGSGGIHNVEYALAGLEKAKLWAQSANGTLSATLSSPIATGEGMTVNGSLLGAGGAPIDDAEVVLETSTDSSTWTLVAAAQPDASGHFSIPTGLVVGNRWYRVRFSPSEGVEYQSSPMHVAVPVTSATLTPAAANVSWQNIASATVTMSATPGATTLYTLSGATFKAPTVYSGPISITAEGRTEVRFWSTDSNGTEAPQTLQVLIDRAAPRLATDVKVRYSEKAVVRVWAADSGAGVTRIVCTFRGVTRTVYGSNFTLTTRALGKSTLSLRAYDRAGRSAAKAVTVWVRTTPTFAVSPSTTRYIRAGASVSFAATVKSAGGAYLAGEPVALQRWNGSGWTTVAIRVTSATGRVSKAVTFGSKGTKWYRWRVAASTRCNAEEGQLMKVVVK